MMPILGLSIATFIGLVIYAGLHSLLHYLHYKRSIIQGGQYLFFSLLCLAGIGYMVSELAAYYSHDAIEYARAFRVRETFIVLSLIILPWFIYSYTGVGPRSLVWGLSGYALLQFIPNMTRPYGGYFDELPVIKEKLLPWGEQVMVHADKSMNLYGVFLWAGLLSFMGYMFYACYRQYKNGARKKAAMLAGTMFVVNIFVLEGLFVRAGLLDFIFIAQYGFPALIILMGIVLHRESREFISRIFSIVDYVPAVIYMKDTEGKYLLVNHEYESLFGINQDEVLGRTDKDLFDGEIAREFQKNDNNVLGSKKAIEFEELARHADGSEHTYSSVKFPLFDANGTPYAVGGISTDITEQKQQQSSIVQNEIKYRTLFDNAGEAIFLMRGDKFIDCNAKTLEMFGCRREYIIGNTPVLLSPHEQYNGRSSREMVLEKINLALDGKPQYFEWLHCRLDGTRFDAEVCLNRIEIDGEPCLQAIVRDVTTRRRNEEALLDIATGVTGQFGDLFYQQMVKSLCKLFNSKYAFIGLLDDESSRMVNTIATCNDGNIIDNMSYNLENTPCENVIGQETCSYPDNVQDLFKKDALLQQMGVESYIGTPLFDIKRKPVGLVVVMDEKPMTGLEQVQPILEIFAARAAAELERVKAEKHIRRMAYKDYLTGLSNRAALHEQVTRVLDSSRVDNTYGATLLIDLDHFKTINDALSHDVGDQVLKLVADRLREIASDEAYLARIGGDEFVAVVVSKPGMSEDRFAKYVRKLAANIVLELSRPFHLEKRILYIGASIGVVLFPQQGDNELDVMRRADMALYRAKNSGRGNVQFFESSLQEKADERLQIERWLRNAVENNELEIYYQPQLNTSGQVVGAEALLRWHHPRLGYLQPDRFISIAEETGLIHSIGNWVFREVCQQLQIWSKSDCGFNSHVAVNVSAWQFANPQFVTQILETLAEYQVRTSQIVLELTESALLYDVQDSIEKLDKLRKCGLRIALDDFGTGYSSLAYLKDMAMDILKIDKAFIHELSSKVTHPLIETIIAMGQHMDLDVVAEGVETEEQRSVLILHGCETFQGYLFANPMNRADFEKWIQNYTADKQRISL